MRNVESNDTTMDGPGGRKFYGSVTVGERGQIVIPAQARRDHEIEAGDKLIVLGSPEGIALMGVTKLMEVLSASSQLMNAVREQVTLHDSTTAQEKDTTQPRADSTEKESES